MTPLLADDFTHQTAGGVCGICKMPKRDGDKVVSTGVEIPYEGMLDICTTCIGVLAGVAGLLTPEHQTALNAELADTAARLERAERALAEALGSREKHEAARAEYLKLTAEMRSLVKDARKAVA